jgi:hypothetical protein
MDSRGRLSLQEQMLPGIFSEVHHSKIGVDFLFDEFATNRLTCKPFVIFGWSL